MANHTLKYDWPDDDALVALIVECGGKAAAAKRIGATASGLKHHVRSRGLDERLATAMKPAAVAPTPEPTPGGVRVDGDTVYVSVPTAPGAKLGDYDKLLRERGLDPDDWTVTSASLKEWDALTAVKRGDEPRTVRLKYWAIVLKPAAHRVLLMPAVHVPVVKRTRIGPPPSQQPETIVVEGDHQIPYMDEGLHAASLQALQHLYKKHRLAEQVYLGDTGDYPTISRHPDHPAATATPNQCLQGEYNMLREKREAVPNIRVRKLKGNHDWRIEGEQLARSERMYGIAPAQEWEADEPELPALHFDRLLHLPKLGIELVEDPRGWEHAEVELVPGMYGLVVRHGWLTGAKTAARSVQKRGRSIIVGHIHRREHAFIWDPSAGCERQGVVAGTMSLVRDERFPHYTTLDQWLQGFVIVTRWPDGDFCIEHAKYANGVLRWRDYSWAA